MINSVIAGLFLLHLELSYLLLMRQPLFYGVRRPAPGTGFAHQNEEQRDCGEPSANHAGAAAREKENPGSWFAHQNGEQRVCGEPSANRAGAAVGKKENFGFGFAYQNGE